MLETHDVIPLGDVYALRQAAETELINMPIPGPQPSGPVRPPFVTRSISLAR